MITTEIPLQVERKIKSQLVNNRELGPAITNIITLVDKMDGIVTAYSDYGSHGCSGTYSPHLIFYKTSKFSILFQYITQQLDVLLTDCKVNKKDRYSYPKVKIAPANRINDWAECNNFWVGLFQYLFGIIR